MSISSLEISSFLPQSEVSRGHQQSLMSTSSLEISSFLLQPIVSRGYQQSLMAVSLRLFLCVAIHCLFLVISNPDPTITSLPHLARSSLLRAIRNPRLAMRDISVLLLAIIILLQAIHNLLLAICSLFLYFGIFLQIYQLSYPTWPSEIFLKSSAFSFSLLFVSTSHQKSHLRAINYTSFWPTITSF
jgi:hypothetical protein